MKVCQLPAGRNQARGTALLGALGVMMLGMALAGQPLAAQDKTTKDKDKKDSNKSVGFILSADATAKDLGLPVYPGAQRRKDTSDESSALQMGLWGGSTGFKLALLKLESDDSPEKVAAFYRKALAKYGQVLDCRKSTAKAEKNEKSGGSSSNELKCEDDQPVAGGFTLKAGTKEKQHLVGIEPNGNHCVFTLVYVEAPKSESKKD